jgi:ubiquinone/menaquinone biosynthesis C-methylase UbiE
MTTNMCDPDTGTSFPGPTGSPPTTERRPLSNPYAWLIGLDGIRAMTRRRFGLVGAVPGARILVVGCGTGDDVLALARLVKPGGRAFGVEQAESDLQAARRRAATAGLAAKFHLGPPDDLPFPDASFDGVCAAWLLNDATDPAPVLSEMVRVVRPGGRIVIDDTDWAETTLKAGDPGTVRRILDHQSAAAGATGSRRSFDHLARSAHLINLTTSVTPVHDRYGASGNIFVEMASAAATGGAITPEEAASFKADLALALAHKRFAAELPCITIAGQRP